MRIPLESKVLQNVDETALNRQSAALENAYITETGSLSRFPHLVKYCDLPSKTTVHLSPQTFRNDLVAVCGGRTYLITRNAKAVDVTKDIVSGRGRVVFTQAERDLIMCAGGDIIRYSGDVTERLSITAPKSTHAAYVDGYLVALEENSGRFSYSSGDFVTWDPLDTFSAAGKPDNLNSLLVTDYNELILGGTDTMEQFNTAQSGIRSFFRRWMLGDGIIAPYTLLFANNQVWGVTRNKEFISFAAQAGRVRSEDIQARLEAIEDFTDSWTQELVIKGQRFLVLQIPKGINAYGTTGITFLYDYAKQRWSNLYGYDNDLSSPSLWDGRSIASAYGKVFVGGEGAIYTLEDYNADELSNPQPMLWRSGLIRFPDSTRGHINRLFIHAKRGANPVNDDVPSIISLRVNKDNKGWSDWKRRSLGKAGQNDIIIHYPSLGMATTWQFEIKVSDRGAVEISMMDAELGQPASR